MWAKPAVSTDQLCAASLRFLGKQHHRIVTMTKVYIASNNIHVEIILFHTVATLVTFETRHQRVYRAPVVSEDSNFDLPTALFHVTMYRQFARKVCSSANSALIRYYLPRLKLSSSTRVCEGTNA